MTGQEITAGAMQPVPGRACGSCTMCCKVLLVGEIAKPPGVWCKQAKPGTGCAIYAGRPESCRAYYCEWMVNSAFGPEWKPDSAKFAVSPPTSGSNLLIAVDPNFPNAWRKEPYHSQIRRWVKAFEPMGRFIIVRTGSRCLALLPDKEIDLGAVEANDEIMIGRDGGPAGYVYSAEVRKAAN